MGKSLKRLICLGLACLLYGTSLEGWPPIVAHASVSYTFSDTPTDVMPEGGDITVSGNYMAFADNDDKGIKQIYMKDVTTGVKTQITNTTDRKVNPSMKGNLVVWSSNVSSFKMDVYSYNLTSKQITKVNSQPGYFLQASTDGTYVVWYDGVNENQMYVYDSATGVDKLIGKGRIPKVADGKVLYKNSNDGLSLYDIKSGVVTNVVDLSYGEYVLEFDFNGTYAVWLQHVGDLSKYVMINAIEPVSGAKDLTPAILRAREYLSVKVGNGTAAWIDDQNGQPAIEGVNLQTKETFELAPPSTTNMFYGFNGSQSIIKGSNGAFVYRLPVRIETPDTQPTQYGSAPVISEEARKQIGPEGGELSADHGNVSLKVDKDTFTDNTWVEIKQTTDKAAIATSPSSLKPVSAAWSISFKNAIKPLALNFSCKDREVAPQQMLKMGIYHYDEVLKEWVYSGGTVNSNDCNVGTPITQEGTYSLMINDVRFTDIKGHWAQQPIEILASRWIVNGMETTNFVPDASLTRGQFTKMLVGALGLKEDLSGKATFKDVGAAHWSAGWVEAAYKAGIIQGDGDVFGPDQSITREQMMAMLVRALGIEQQAKSMSPSDLSKALTYKDADKVSEWAKPYAALAVQQKLIEGDSEGLRPSDASTRAQAAIVMLRILEHLHKL
ncbi:S-layer homology domain-containing protein [Paenibacillus sp. Soil787]|uniref:S-layer homology domain-containing protein n=1 Tax=Paenibacillus sp. Soil787 TaxID=1736411 RepID=UPI0007030F65|nr:S-layer homology domain-containing protein [Paenibacillus sp. Soil787]KRF27662.1 hypothetical protein ASG93_29405 [Paenibacillus sp. Soil787]